MIVIVTVVVDELILNVTNQFVLSSSNFEPSSYYNIINVGRE